MSDPLVSYIVLSYNQEHYIKDAVESALAQEYPNIEFIFSDDCSTDRTFQIMQQGVQSYKGSHRVEIYQQKINKGLAGNINFTVGKASGEFIIIAGGDDIAYPYKTRKLVKPMIQRKNFIAVHSAFDLINVKGEILGKRVRSHERVKTPQQVVQERYKIVAQCQAFRRSVFDFFGPFQAYVNDEGLPFAFREACLGDIYYVPEPLIQYRLGDGESSRRSIDTNGRTIKDPIKYASWDYNSYRQILIDYELVKTIHPDLSNLISQQLNRAKYFYYINLKSWEIKSLFMCLRYGIGFKAFKSFLRRNAPFWIRNLYFESKKSYL